MPLGTNSLRASNAVVLLPVKRKKVPWPKIGLSPLIRFLLNGSHQWLLVYGNSPLRLYLRHSGMVVSQRSGSWLMSLVSGKISGEKIPRSSWTGCRVSSRNAAWTGSAFRGGAGLEDVDGVAGPLPAACSLTAIIKASPALNVTSGCVNV